LLDHIRTRFDVESGNEILAAWKKLCDKAAGLQKAGVSPESETGQELAGEWWEMVMAFTGGDMSLLPDLIKMSESMGEWDDEWKEKQAIADVFVPHALKTYFEIQGFNPFKEARS
jgi:hypothetical protein